MDKQALIDRFNAALPPAMQTLRGRIADFDRERHIATLSFSADRSMCNPNDGLQGGFICGMLDAAMAFAVYTALGEFAIVATLEIKVNFLEIARPGALAADGRVVRLGKTVSFLEAELRDDGGKLLATATQTARVIRQPADRSAGGA